MKDKMLLAMTLAASMGAAVLLGGCGAQSETVSDGKNAAEMETELVEIEIVTGQTVTLPEENFINEALSEELGIKLTFNILGAGSDYATALNTRIAGGDIPDIFMIPKDNSETFYQYIKNGTLLDLTPYKDQLQTVIDWGGGEEGLIPNMYQDKLYAIPKKWRTSYHTWVVRQDWLDKLGLEVPTTLEDGLEVAKAITFNDPDGNGKDDTYGFSFYDGVNAFNAMLNPYDGAVTNNIIIRDGKVTSSLLQEGMEEGLEMCKKWVDAGVVDPDIIANTLESEQDKVYQGQLGMCCIDWAGIYKKANMNKIKSVSPDADWQCINALTNGDSGLAVYDIMDVTNVRGDFSVGANVGKDPEKLQKVIELLNYIVSEEGNRLLSYGIEGRHYNLEEGNVVPTELMTKECDFLWAYQICFRDDLPYLQTKFPEAKEQVDFVYGIDRYEVYNAAVELPEGFYKADMDKYIEENMIKFIYGQRPISEYGQFIEELNNQFRFDEYLEIAAQQLEEKGYLK